MNLANILKSPQQRRTFLGLFFLILIVCFAVSLLISYNFKESTFWGVFNNFFISVFASATFSVIAIFYLTYFFHDPEEMLNSTLVLPGDISKSLMVIASNATNYRIFVRTGRHFRSNILPILVHSARERKQKINIDVILLDFRDISICNKYTEFRKSCSFDKELWSLEYTQSEILATILTIFTQARQNPGIISATIHLSSRLSIFRIEGSSEELIVTREDPKNTAARYQRKHPDFGSYITELNWIQESSASLPPLLQFTDEDQLMENFSNVSEISSLRSKAQSLDTKKSPYAK
jgi:hypothetical protein